MRGANERGFTLIEMLVALMIFVLIAGAGIALLRGAADGQAQSGTALDRQAGLWRARAIIAQDMAGVLPRLNRTPDGLLAPAFFGRPAQEAAPVAQFIRAASSGMADEDEGTSPDIIKLEYRLRGGRLERIVWSHIDGGAPGEPLVLIDRIERLELAWRDEAGEWLPEWRGVPPDALPRALRLTVTRTGAPPLTLLFPVAPALSRKRPE